MHPEGIDSKLLVGRAEMDSDQHCTQAGVPRGKFGSDQFGSSTVGHQHCAKTQASAYHTENPPMYVLKRVTPIRPVEHCFLKGLRSFMGCRQRGLDEFFPPEELVSWQDKPADDRELGGLFFTLSPSPPQAFYSG